MKISSYLRRIELPFIFFGEANDTNGVFNSPINAIEDSIIFMDSLQHADWVAQIHFSIFIVTNRDIYEQCKHFKNKCFIVTDNPKFFFCKLFYEFYPEKIFEMETKKQTKLNRSVQVHNSAFVSMNALIGENTIVEAGAQILGDSVIGSNCRIGSNTVVGKDGFGFVKHKNEIIRFPHQGKVIIGDHVEIGANTVIDRGSLSDTVIQEKVKIDNLVHIAHNVYIGKRTVVIANSTICGSVIIDEDCWIAPSTVIRQGLRVGKGVFIGMGSVVTKDMPDGVTAFGVPARIVSN